MSKIAASERKHIVFAGRRNAGKSSLMNKFIGQDLVIVSSEPGTTTDPVKKSMELLPFGPVVLVDTAGIDDFGELGEKRISKTIKSISEADFVLIVISGQDSFSNYEFDLIDHLQKIEIPFLIVVNKSDLGINYKIIDLLKERNLSYHTISCLNDKGIFELKEKVSKLIPEELEQPLIGDLVKQHDIIILVVPIDLGAPKGRLIMPQVQTIREALDEDTIVVVAKDKHWIH